MHSGENAVSYIKHHTNIDLSRRAQVCKLNPIVKAHTTASITRYDDQCAAAAQAMVLTMKTEKRMKHIKEMLKHLTPEEPTQLLNGLPA